MTRVRARGEDIRRFILERVEREPADVAKATAERFKITRQAAGKHLQNRVTEGALRRTGNTSATAYKLTPLFEWHRDYEIKPGLAEDVVWTDDVKAALGHLPDNALSIWLYGFTEMFNNAIDHSGGTLITVHVWKTAVATEMAVGDNGVGIFRKIQAALGLLDERHSVLELAKGKLTTDPKRHTGEGIFFTSRMFDRFAIVSGGVYFSHEFGNPEDWILERLKPGDGTWVFMNLNNHTSRSTTKVFNQFTNEEDLGFTKTVV